MPDVQLLSQADQQHRRIYIDGVLVDTLLESVFRSRKEEADGKGINFSFELIAWDAVTAAADRDLLREALQSALSHAIEETQADGTVVLRAYPSHDDVCVTFEVVDSRPNPVSGEELQRWNEHLEPIQRVVERMGGEWHIFNKAAGGLSVCITLAQWVTVDMGKVEEKCEMGQLTFANLAA